MRILIISDVHGNLPALEYVLEQERDADLVISLGDVVNYGPWSNECVELLASLDNKVLLKGNHEEAFISGTYSGDHPIARSFFLFCEPLFRHKETINEYSPGYVYKDFDFVHTLENKYIFPDTDVDLNRNTFIGHSHALFSKMINGYRLINAGSVGQNRRNIDELNYVVWLPGEEKIDLISRPFKADKLISEMKCMGYPQHCIDYILSKRHAA